MSWAYLRFFQLHGSVPGDASDSFAFSEFFPQLLQCAALASHAAVDRCRPAVAAAGKAVFAALVRIRICSEQHHADLGAASAIKLPIPGAADCSLLATRTMHCRKLGQRRGAKAVRCTQICNWAHRSRSQIALRDLDTRLKMSEIAPTAAAAASTEPAPGTA